MGKRFFQWGLAVGLTAAATAVAAAPHIPEVARSDIQHVAVVSWVSGALPNAAATAYDGPVVYVNPELSAALGTPLTDFFRAQAQCHATLGHLHPQFFSSDPLSRTWLNEALELEADECAIRALLSQGKVLAALDAFSWYQGNGPTELLPFSPPATSRADNILKTARLLGKNLQ